MFCLGSPLKQDRSSRNLHYLLRELVNSIMNFVFMTQKTHFGRFPPHGNLVCLSAILRPGLQYYRTVQNCRRPPPRLLALSHTDSLTASSCFTQVLRTDRAYVLLQYYLSRSFSFSAIIALQKSIAIRQKQVSIRYSYNYTC